ncbi:alpha/beta hydrolase family protein [Bacillus massilinigeriensis]|uniref:hypothetical protein n=1 Tax=Bacillus mediterraneensis TaxID=1805474 RepID=UPI0013565C13|nr:hypothetical protein [Bacillus mediterraneensis]
MKIEKEIGITIDGERKVWKLVGSKSNKWTGFKAIAYKNNNDIIIAYRGTDKTSAPDLFTDVAYIVFEKNPMKGINNQFAESLEFGKEIKKKYPNTNISSTGHSLGSANSHFTGAILGWNSVTFSGPATINSLPKEYREAAKAGKFDKTHVNYIYTDDPVGGGFLNSWTEKRPYIGTTYALGYRYEHENFGDGIIDEAMGAIKKHPLSTFKFDKYGNIKGDIFTNLSTGEEMYKSPHYMGSAVAGTIQLKPEVILERADEMKHRINQVEQKHEEVRASLLSFSHISEAEYIEENIHREMNEFIRWYGEKTTRFENILRETAKIFVEADKLK